GRSARPRLPHLLPAFAELQFDIVNDRTDGNEFHRQAVARLDVDPVAAGHDFVADLELVGREDVAALPVGVAEQREPRRAVRVVFDRLDARRNAALVALEGNQPERAVVAAAAVMARNTAGVVAAAGPLQRLDEALLGLRLSDLFEAESGAETDPVRGRVVSFYRHNSISYFGF